MSLVIAIGEVAYGEEWMDGVDQGKQIRKSVRCGDDSFNLGKKGFCQNEKLPRVLLLIAGNLGT